MGASRDFTKYEELILPVFTQWERVGSVTGILTEHENGQFYDSALLWDQMLRDDRIAAVFDVRINSVLGSPMHHEPAREIAKARKIADDADELWWDMVPRSELRLLYRWGIGLGVGIARREWNGWQPRLKTWHPGALWFNIANDTYYLRHSRGEIAIDPEDPNWVLFTPYGYKYARTQGLIRQLAMPFLARQWAFRDRARHSERHGMPFLQGITPAEADTTTKKLFKSSLASIGSETVVVTPQGKKDDGNLWDVKLIESKSNSHEVFSAQLDHIDSAIAIVVLGQSMSTQGQPGLGSQEKAGDSVRADVKKFDASTLGDLGNLIEQPWVKFNYGDPELTPCPMFEVDPPEDGNLKAQELNTLGDALGKLERFGVNVRELLEETGVPMLSVEEAAAKAKELADAAMAAQQAMKTPTVPGDQKKPGPVAA